VCIVVVESFNVLGKLEGRVDLGVISLLHERTRNIAALLRIGPEAAALQPCLRILFLV